MDGVVDEAETEEATGAAPTSEVTDEKADGDEPGQDAMEQEQRQELQAVEVPMEDHPVINDTPAIAEDGVKEPAATDEAITDSVAKEPAATDEAIIDSVAKEPAATDEAITDSVAKEPAATDEAIIEIVAKEPVATDEASRDAGVVDTGGSASNHDRPTVPEGVADQDQGASRAEASASEQEAPPTVMSLEVGTHEKLLMRRAAVRQMRADLRVRLDRRRELQAEVEALDRDITRAPETLRQRSAELEAATRDREQKRSTAASRAEETLNTSRAELAKCTEKVEHMQQRLVALKESRQALDEERSEGGAYDKALKSKQRQVEALTEDAAAQEQKMSLLKADLRSLLDFMMRVNVEAAGGPSKRLGPQDFMSPQVVQSLGLSVHGQTLLQKLMRKYEAFMASCAEEPGEGEEAAAQAAGTLAPVVELPCGSVEEEALLLRNRLTDEMEQVAKVLSASDAGVPSRTRRQRELLRVAAWGDGQALRRLLAKDRSASASSGDAGTGGTGESLQGWSPWHAAAAHGQKNMVEVLQEVASEEGPAPLNAALSKCTASGWTALGVACIQGHTEAVEALLQAKASVQARDSRGNSPLFWAAAAEDGAARPVLMKLLLEARADPEARNGSGLILEPHMLAQLLPTENGDHSATAASAAVDTSAAGDIRRGDEAHEVDATSSRGGMLAISGVNGDLPYHCIYTLSGQRQEGASTLLAYTASLIVGQPRDAAGVLESEQAKQALALSSREVEHGLWSSPAIHYTHAGLARVLSDPEVIASPLSQEHNQQVLVLTCDRLVLLHSKTWSVMQALRLADVTEVCIHSRNNFLLVLHASTASDVLLDVESRDSFLQALREATVAVAKQWGGGGFEDQPVPVNTSSEPIMPLFNSQQKRVGNLAFVEADVVLILPHIDESVLLSSGTLFFGFLDLIRAPQNEATVEVPSRWQVFFCVLKDGQPSGSSGRLHWCHSPNDKESLGSVDVGEIEDTMFTSAAEAPAAASSHAQSGCPLLSLRAKSAQSRDDWLVAIRAAGQGGSSSPEPS